MDFDPFFCVSVFQGTLLVIVFMIESSKKKRLLNFRVHVFLKSTVMPSQEGNNFVLPRGFTCMA